jgi:hypothetical protein
MVSGWLDRLHYPLLGLAVLLLGTAFFFAYVRRPTRRNKVIAWASAFVTGVITALRHL